MPLFFPSHFQNIVLVLFTMSSLPDKMWDSVQKEYRCHGSDTSALIHAPPLPGHQVCVCVCLCVCEYLDKSYYAAHGICVKNSLVHQYCKDSLTAGQNPFSPSSKRTETCSPRQWNVQDEVCEQRPTGRKTGKSATVSIMGSVHLMGRKEELMWAYYVRKWAWALCFSVSVVLLSIAICPYTASGKHHQICKSNTKSFSFW